MKRFTTLLVTTLLLFLGHHTEAKSALEKCLSKQVKPLQEKYLNFYYREQLNEFYHSPLPWQQKAYEGKGTVWCNGDHFLKQDTLVSGKRILYSKTELNKDELLYTDYGQKDLSPITSEMLANQLWECARYSPMLLIRYFSEQKLSPENTGSKDFAVYKVKIGKSMVTMHISKINDLVEKVTVLNYDELYGDVLTSIYYSDYTTAGLLSYPKKIIIEKINSKLKDEIVITNASFTPLVPKLLDKPTTYSMAPNTVEPEEIKLEKYTDNIYFLDLMHAGAKAMIVVFKNFILVAEAPLNNKNGELIISEAKKIAPGKPVRYFTFGHHHPHYLGGMRAFIHKGAIVLSTKSDEEYIRYLAHASHSLQPDSLQYQYKQVSIQEIKDSTTISDGEFEMKIYFVGKQSGHTEDYLVYYFLEEQLLFEGDLVWINKNNTPAKAGETQSGLYHFIKEHNLRVNNIVQSWGISFKDYKTEIPFADVEKSMQIK